MATPGFIYALINSSFPSYVKIGRTSRTPAERAAELSSVTGLPTEFTVAYAVDVADSESAERFVHDLFANQGLRVSGDREFFRVDLPHAIEVLLSVKQQFGAAGTVGRQVNLNYSKQALRAISDRLAKARAYEEKWKEEKAAQEYVQLAETGYAPALVWLSCLSRFDLDERLEFLSRAEERGVSAEQRDEIFSTQMGRVERNDFRELAVVLAGNGHVPAMTWLGTRVSHLESSGPDDAVDLEFLKEAANKHQSLDALVHLAELYFASGRFTESGDCYTRFFSLALERDESMEAIGHYMNEYFERALDGASGKKLLAKSQHLMLLLGPHFKALVDSLRDNGLYDEDIRGKLHKSDFSRLNRIAKFLNQEPLSKTDMIS